MAPKRRFSHPKLINLANLRLAWRRLNTAGPSYKRYFREVYAGYEFGLEENLQRLRQELLGAWVPSRATRVMTPKGTQLHRPITLLPVESQIIYQAVANEFSRVLDLRRTRVERIVAFANIRSTRERDVFFTRRWQENYDDFVKVVRRYFRRGFHWVVFFDLTEFYETIGHEELFERVSAAPSSDLRVREVMSWLRRWNSGLQSGRIAHGIPQGTQASDFLAECMMLPVDERMIKLRIPYFRYVDDIRILARTESDAWRHAFELELLCRGLGLLPSGSKFKVSKVSNVDEVVKGFGSGYGYHAETSRRPKGLSRQQAEHIFGEAVGGKPLEVKDKSKLRLALFRAPRSERILRSVLALLGRHPEHIDAFAAFISNYGHSRRVEARVVDALVGTAFHKHARGELWHILARMGRARTLRELIPLALQDLNDSGGAATLEWGIGHFLIACSRSGSPINLRLILRMNPQVQALLAQEIPDNEFTPGGIVPRFLRSRHIEPGLAIVPRLTQPGISLTALRVRPQTLAPQVQHALRGIGVIGLGATARVDQIGRLMNRRFAVPYSNRWRRLLGPEYYYALSQLRQTDHLYDSSRSTWLMNTNAFNDIVVRRLLGRLRDLRRPGSAATTESNGDLIDYGRLIQAGTGLSTHYPQIVDGLRRTNTRRNRIPGAHPYRSRGGSRNAHLTRPEQRQFTKELSGAYRALVALLPSL